MDSGVSGTYHLYCHWHWIFPPHDLALVGDGFSGSLQDEITLSPLVTKPFSNQVRLWEGKSFLLYNLLLLSLFYCIRLGLPHNLGLCGRGVGMEKMGP